MGEINPSMRLVTQEGTGDLASTKERSHEDLTKKRFQRANLAHPVMAELLKLAIQGTARGTGPHRQDGGDATRDLGLPPNEFREKVRISLKNIKLPALPQIFPRLQQAINDPESSASDLAGIISLDPSLSACLLRIVNSPFYGFPSKIDTITKAVTVLGSRQLYTLAMGAVVLNLFKEPIKHIDIELFWKHSIACGVIARAIAAESKKGEKERYFVAGLLHDIGRLALFRAVPDLVWLVESFAERNNVISYEAERRLLGFDHARLGATLVHKWGFPPALTAALLYHHCPGKAKNQDEAGTVHLADIVTKAVGIGLSGDSYVPPLNEQIWKRLGLSPEALSGLIGGLGEELDSTFAMLGAS